MPNYPGIRSTVEYTVGDGTYSIGQFIGLPQAMNAVAALPAGTKAKLRLGNGFFFGSLTSVAPAYKMAGLVIEGSGPGTVLEINTTSPAQVTDFGVVEGTTRTLTTDALGFYIEPHDGVSGDDFAMGNLKLVGLTSTPLVGGHYTLFRVAGHHMRLFNIYTENEKSLVGDASNNAPYKSLFARGVRSLAIFAGGTDPWVRPDPNDAVGNLGLFIDQIHGYGEPILEMVNGAQASLIFFSGRKLAFPQISRFALGEGFDRSPNVALDFVFSSNPAVNAFVDIDDWDAARNERVVRRFTFKSSVSGVFDVLIGGSAAATAQNFAARVTNSNVNNAGATTHLEGQAATEYIQGATGSTPCARVRGLRSTVVGRNAVVPPTTGATSSTGSILVRPVHVMRARSGMWRYGIYLQDCYGGILGPGTISSDIFVGGAIYSASTMPTGFQSPAVTTLPNNPWNQGGRLTLTGISALGCAYPTRFVEFGGNGQLHITNSCRFDLMTAGTTEHSKSPLIHVDKGVNRQWRTVIGTAGSVANGATITVNDGSGIAGQPRVFTLKTSPTGSIYDVQIAAGDMLSTARNVRAKIQASLDAHEIMAYVSTPALDPASSGYVLYISTFTRGEYDGNESVLVSGSGLSVTALHRPAMPESVTYEGNTSQVGGFDISTGFYSAPILRVDACAGAVIVNATMHHVFDMCPAVSARMVQTLTNVANVEAATPVTVEETGNAGADAAAKKFLPKSTGWNATGTSGGLWNGATQITIAVGATSATFIFDSTAHADASPLFAVDVRGATLNSLYGSSTAHIAKYLQQLADKINATSLINGLVYAKYVTQVYPSGDTDAETVAYPVLYLTTKGASNALSVTVTSTNFSTANFAIANPEENAGGAGSLEPEYEFYPIVLVDPLEATVSVRATPWAHSTYHLGSNIFRQTIGRSFATEHVSAGFSTGLAGGFVGIPIKVVFVKKTAALKTCKLTLQSCDLKGPWGEHSTGTNKLFDIGGSMLSGDVVCAGNVVNGVAV